MILDRLEFINEEFYAAEVDPTTYDRLLAEGWRHFGMHFFRYNYGIYNQEIRRVLPLRINLAKFKYSKSQRRILNRNGALDIQILSAVVTPEIDDLFHKHKARFQSGVPDSIFDFISRNAHAPTECLLLTVRDNSRLVAASYFDLGSDSISSIYGIFDPDLTAASLGIFTLLKEIEFARENGKSFFYHGYAYEGESFYDYKKRFGALEIFDWKGKWSEPPA